MRGDVPEGDSNEIAVAVARSPLTLTMPACVRSIIYNMSFNLVHVHRTKLFMFVYMQAFVKVYEHVCRTRLVCTESCRRLSEPVSHENIAVARALVQDVSLTQQVLPSVSHCVS